MRDAYSESGTSAGAAAPGLAAFLTRTARPLIPGRACRPGRAASRSAVDVRARRRRQSRVAAGALLALASLFAGAMDARAQTDITLVSNLNQGDDESVTRGGRIAQVFTTGSDARGYRLSSVDVISEDSDSDSFSLSVCSVGTDTHPTTTCTTFTAPSSFAAGTLSFTAPADTVLEANTDYAVVVTATGNSVTYDTTEANGEDSGAATGWSIQDFYKFVNSSNAWENTNSGAALRIAIKGTPNLYSDAKLSGLRLSHGGTDIALDPAFDPDTDTYTATVTGATEITITPVTRSGVATYEFRTADNSAAITDASGAADFQMRLLDGENDIRVQVTAEDGTTENFYILTVTSIPGVSIRTVNAGGDAIAGIDEVLFVVTRTGATASALAVTVTMSQDQDFLSDSLLSKTVTIGAGLSSERLHFFTGQISIEGTADGTLTATVAAGTGYEPASPSSAAVAIRVAAAHAITILIEEDGYTVDEDIGTLEIAVSAHVAYGLPKPDSDVFASVGTRASLGEGNRASPEIDFATASDESPFTADDFRNNHGFWVARRTVSVRILDDDLDEDVEQFMVLMGRNPISTAAVRFVYPSGETCYSEGLGVNSACAHPVLIYDDDGTARGSQLDESEGTPLTAEFRDLPPSHDGEAAFTFELAFSADIEGLSYATVRDSVLSVTGGRVTQARRLAAPSNRRWGVTVKPAGDAEVTIMVPPTTDCDAAGALCTADGRMLAIGRATLVPGPQAAPQPEALPDFTARFESVPDTHDGESPVVFRLAFSEEPANYSYATLRDRTLNVWQGSRLDVRRARRLDAPSNRRWEVTVAPVSKADLTVGLGPTRDCADNGAVCTSDGRMLANMIHKVIKGPPAIAVADARVREAEGATVDFAVSLSRAASETVTVQYATSDGTATAGSDYTATSGALTFAPGETAKTVSVPVLDDSHDEGSETFTLTLSNASGGGAWLKDATATGTIENDDPMPQAWLARFGRTVAEQVIDAVQARLGAAPQPGVEVTLAGQRIGYASGSGDGADDTADADRRAAEVRQEREAQAKVAALSDWLQGETGEAGSRAGLQSRVVTERDLLTGTSFALTAGGEGGGVASLWGRGALSSFDGREGDLTLEGEVTSAMIGADWRRDAWTAGLLVSHSRGEGGYRAPAGGGTVSSSVTGLYPYGRYMANERVTLWGVAGYGEGTLTLTPENPVDGEDDRPIRTGMDLMMGALGVRGVVVEAPPEGGPELAVKSDAMAVSTASEKTDGLAAARGDVTRLRLGLEGTWRGIEAGGGTLTPRMEIGVRHDGGDAETGFGLDVGGGLAWSHPANGIAAEVSGRGLLTHEAKGFRDRGIAGSLAWDPGRGSGRGPKLTLTQTMGASAAGGVDALLGRGTLGGLGANDDGDELANRRLELRLGYGFSVLGDRFTSTPELGLALSNGHRDYSLGWRLGLAQRGVNALELKLEATRREKADGAANDNDAEHGIGFRVTARW